MKILVVVDMQNDFLDGPLGNDMCRATVPEVVKLIESVKWDGVFVTQDTHFDNYPETLEGKKLPVTHCLFQSNGWQLNSDVERAVMIKWTYLARGVYKPTFGSFNLLKQIEDLAHEHLSDPHGSFENPELLSRMASTGQNFEFHVCGVCTSICVLANTVLLRAKYPDAKIIVHAKACGDVTQEMHDAALVCFKSQQCEVVD